MIINDRQYDITKDSCEKFKQALRDLQQEIPADENAKGLLKTQEDAIKSQILDIKTELLKYVGPAYRVYLTDEKVYIEDFRGCIARFCRLSAEFFYTYTWIDKCTFKQFQIESLKRGFAVEDKYCPEWAK